MISLVFFLANPFIYSGEEHQDKNVLILYSLPPNTPAYRIITDGIRSKLQETYGEHVYLHTEYLETNLYPDGEYPKERFDLYNRKYASVNLDLLVCVGINIVEPVKKSASSKIMELPAITIDFDLTRYKLGFDLNLNDRTSAIGMTLNITRTLNAALDLFPEKRNVYFISGVSRVDLIYFNATKKAINEFKEKVKYEFIENVSMDEALDRVRHLPDSSLIIVSSFNIDTKGVPYYNPESVRLISQASNAPVFAYSDMGFGEGAVGGYILSFKKIGFLAGDIAVKILHGTDPASIIVTENDIYEYLLDWRQLKRWDKLGSKLIPKGNRIMFEEVNFFEKYRTIIIIAVLFLLLQSLFIIQLVRLNRRQRIITNQLIATENKFLELAREDRILSLGQLTASLSHELNQPLTAILSTAQAGLRFVDSGKHDPELIRQILGNIVEDDKRTASILSSIRGMMKLETREKEMINLNELIEEVIQIFQGESIRKMITFNLEMTGQPVFILADKIQIQQVIMNLINNAFQSINQAKSGVRKVVIHEETDQDTVTVSLRDYGTGIKESVRDKLFRPFVTTGDEGTGIGLAISRSIIEDHGGKIWAENMADGGAVFFFSLKICKNEQDAG